MADTQAKLDAKRKDERIRKQRQTDQDKKDGLKTFRVNRVSKKVHKLLTAYYETVKEDAPPRRSN